jgi:hypothetical protein
MNSIIRKAAQFAAALGFALAAGTASASPIVLDQWYTFGFSGSGGDPLIAGAPGFTLGIRSVAIGDPAWTFDCPTSHCKIVVTDGFLALDEFELFDFGVSIGVTSPTADDPSISCGNDELACLADPNFSHGVFIVGAGAHSITGTHLVGIPGAAFLIVTVPEPAPLLLVGIGLLMLVAMRRRA